MTPQIKNRRSQNVRSGVAALVVKQGFATTIIIDEEKDLDQYEVGEQNRETS